MEKYKGGFKMNWILIFWMCTASCENNITYGKTVEIKKVQKILFFEEKVKAIGASWDLEFMDKLSTWGLDKNGVLCSAIKLYEIKLYEVNKST